MKSHIASNTIAVLAFFGMAASASAQIELYALRAQQAYEQTGDNQIASSYFRFDAQLRTTNANDLAYVTLDGATGGQINLTQNGNYWSHVSQGYGNLAALEAAYPVSSYTLTAGGGIYNQPQQMTVDFSPTWPDVQPMLTGSTFTDLSLWNPGSSDFLMTFNSHQEVADALYVMTYVTFYDKTTNDGIPIHFSLDNSATSLLLDGSQFAAGHEYYGYLEFFHQFSHDDRPYNGSIKDRTTTFSFTTSTVEPGPGGMAPVPEPSTYGLFAAAALVGVAWYRRSRGQRVQK